MKRALWLSLTLALVLVVACSDDDDDEMPLPTEPAVTTTATVEPATTTATQGTSTETETATQPGGEGTGLVYLLLDQPEKGPFLAPVARAGAATPEDALRLLFEGPTGDEAAGIPSISTSIPGDSELNDVDVEAGIATVDVNAAFEAGGGSFSMLTRLGQVVLTLTAFDTVDSVLFKVDGEPIETFSSEGLDVSGPQTADAYTAVMPPILITSPAWGSEVASPLRVAGTVGVGVTTVRITVVDGDGLIVEEKQIAPESSGTRRPFEVVFTPGETVAGFGAVVVSEAGPEDEQLHLREHAVVWR